MTARRRPLATLFAALLVWLTGVSTASVPRAQERRLMIAGDEAVSTVSVTVPRSSIVVAREVTRLPALPDDLPALVAGVEGLPAPCAPAHVENETGSRARRAQRIASTYDAMAPPVMAAFNG